MKIYQETFPMLDNSDPARINAVAANRNPLTNRPGGKPMTFYFLNSHPYMAPNVHYIGAYINRVRECRSDVLGWKIGQKICKSSEYKAFLDHFIQFGKIDKSLLLEQTSISLI